MDRWQNFRLSPTGTGFLRADCPRCGHTVAISPERTRRLAGDSLVCPECYEHGNREALSMPHALPVPVQ